jgi:hypothetical protein
MTRHPRRFGRCAAGFFIAALSVTPASAAPDATSSVEALLRAYPDHLSRIEGNDLVWRDGTRMPISDGRGAKDFDTLLDHADIDDMLAMPYRAGPPAAVPALNEDPGRVRYEPFFSKMYGDCRKGGVTPHLREIRWLPEWGGGTVKVTTVNRVADRLEAVSRDLAKLPDSFKKFLVPAAGTYNCRAIAGTDRKSMHAYAAAIDINTGYTNYWLWAKAGKGAIPYANRIPFEIVKIFEDHGFVWGGKWYHYDTMHFEYRPELLGRRGD